jgi:glutaredoxin
VTVLITLITKPDCSLCDQAKAVLTRLSGEYDLRLELVALESERGQKLARETGMAFPPAVLFDEEPFSYGRLSERKLRRHLERAARPRG